MGTGLHTKAFTAQDAFVAALAARPELADWRVEYGLPKRRFEKHLWVDEQVNGWEQSPPTTGILTQEETFTLAVFIYRRRTGGTALDVRQEIEAAAGIVAEVLGAQPFLGGVLQFAAISGAEYDSAFADPKGVSREGVLQIKVACTSYLTSA